MKQNTIMKRLKELGIELPEVNKTSGSYVPAVKDGKVLYLAGQVTRVFGQVKYAGKLGKDATIEEAYQGARICGINLLAVMQAMGGGLDNVERILKVNGYINAAPGFQDTPKVLDGASDLFLEVFGESGKHARSAIGVEALPGNSMVEVEMIVRLKEDIDAECI